ncbi:unnamed protein product [Rotaria sp. Silwood1]|nr:unnamed protein product [Rotaria sp. Silwood1]CAF3461251.1 unnamed protein product [Rotaria sp. Silwood1]CAF4575786.1 unnamed protein product [Rotaria sp. Silwood1]CAF4695201.1 unnamed protein product [Rotaria sp. Silwood1]CAF4796091.1 unnamed protein product [Rotaria sp. Silwood1]
MSTTSDTYACGACTYIQSIKRPTCEMCETPNPNFVNPNHESEAGATAGAALFDSQKGDQVIDCIQCGYINIGSHMQICQGCGQSLYNFRGLFTNFNMDLDNRYPNDESDDNKSNDDDDDDDQDVIMVDNTEESQKKGPSGKAAAAVEKGMDDKQLVPYMNRYLLILREQQQQQSQSFTLDYLNECMTELFNTLEYKNDESDGQLTFPACQICCDEDAPMITMKACGHRVVCTSDFNRYLSVRIRDGDILPWIPCPAETCFVPCHVDNITQDGNLTYSDLLSFITTFMLKKLSRNENFITCIKCEKGGFLQMGPPKKQQVTCPICHEKQIIEKGVDGALDPAFKKMIQSGELRECPTCRHLTLKEKGVCNVIECAKCGIWWNWRTKEQGHNGRDLKQRARMNGTLWEAGELRYQQELEARNPKEFKALLERNGIKYDPNYIRGGWLDQ